MENLNLFFSRAIYDFDTGKTGNHCLSLAIACTGPSGFHPQPGEREGGREGGRKEVDKQIESCY
jgi:hypothetical protein